MPISMYHASVPVFLQMLTALSGVLAKAEAQCRSEGRDPAELIGARLAPDMFPLSRQVQIATDHAKGAAARLSGREVPKFEDNEASFEDLKGRIAKTITFVSSVEIGEIEGAEDREVTHTLRDQPRTFSGQHYLLHLALPNFYFHVTTAYGILRQNGITLGKTDFLGAS